MGPERSFSSARHPAWGPARNRCSLGVCVRCTPSRKEPDVFCASGHCSRVAAPPFLEVGASEQVRSTRWNWLHGPVPPCCPPAGAAPLCHWSAGQQLGTAGAQGRLAHMVVFFSLELPWQPSSKTSSTIPTTPAPAPASCATLYPTQLLSTKEGAPCSQGIGWVLRTVCSMLSSTWGVPRACVGEALGLLRSKDKSRALQGEEQLFCLGHALSEAPSPSPPTCDHGSGRSWP